MALAAGRRPRRVSVARTPSEPSADGSGGRAGGGGWRWGGARLRPVRCAAAAPMAARGRLRGCVDEALTVARRVAAARIAARDGRAAERSRPPLRADRGLPPRRRTRKAPLRSVLRSPTAHVSGDRGEPAAAAGTARVAAPRPHLASATSRASPIDRLHRIQCRAARDSPTEVPLDRPRLRRRSCSMSRSCSSTESPGSRVDDLLQALRPAWRCSSASSRAVDRVRLVLDVERGRPRSQVRQLVV